MEDNMARLYGYCRKSTEEQNETSFSVQEEYKKIINPNYIKKNITDSEREIEEE